MKFFNLFKKKQEAKEEKITIGKVIELLNQEIKKINERGQYSKLSEPLVEDYLDIKNALKALETAEKSEDIYQRLESSANNMKNYFIKILSPYINAKPAKASTLEQLNYLINEAAKLFEASKVVGTEKAAIVDAVYGREMQKLGLSIKKLALEIDMIREKIKEDNLKVELKRTAIRELNELQNLIKGLESIREKKETTKRKLKEQEDNIEINKNKLEAIKAKNDYKELMAKSLELEKKNKEIALLEKQAETNIFIISRALKKYSHSNPKDADLINNIISSPLLIYETDFTNVLSKLKDFVETSKIHIINEMLSDKPKKQYIELKSGIEKIKNELNKNPLINEKQQTEKIIEQTAQDIGFSRQDLKDLNEKEQKISVLINSKKAKIQEKLEREFNKKLVLIN